MREQLDPLPTLEQAAEESVEDFEFRARQALDAWLTQPRVEAIEEEVETVETIEGRHVASWIENEQLDELVSRGLRVVRQADRPDYEPRNSELVLDKIAVGDPVRDFEEWQIVPFEPERLRELISVEVRNRIFAEADTNTQMNMTAAATSGSLDEDDMVQYRAAFDWVNAMRTRAAELSDTLDADYFLDEKWPEPTPELRAFAARY
jgi:hypothetical protein